MFKFIYKKKNYCDCIVFFLIIKLVKGENFKFYLNIPYILCLNIIISFKNEELY